MDNMPLKIKLVEKDLLQLDSDLFIFAEGEGMCQVGAVDLFQCRHGDVSHIRFHKKDLKKLIAVLSGKIPVMSSSNDKEFNKNLQDLENKLVDW